MRKYIVSFFLLTCSIPAIAGSYFTCTNPETGSKVFSRTPCGTDAERRRERPVNSGDMGHYKSRAAEIQANEALKEDVVEQRRQEAIERRKEKELEQVSKVPPGAEKVCAELERKARWPDEMSSRQHQRLLWCRGQGPKPERLRPPPGPSIITNCDAGGCWDNQGKRYNSGGGPTMIRQDGRVCQRIGGMMQCN